MGVSCGYRVKKSTLKEIELIVEQVCVIANKLPR